MSSVTSSESLSPISPKEKAVQSIKNFKEKLIEGTLGNVNPEKQEEYKESLEKKVDTFLQQSQGQAENPNHSIKVEELTGMEKVDINSLAFPFGVTPDRLSQAQITENNDGTFSRSILTNVDGINLILDFKSSELNFNNLVNTKFSFSDQLLKDLSINEELAVDNDQEWLKIKTIYFEKTDGTLKENEKKFNDLLQEANSIEDPQKRLMSFVGIFDRATRNPEDAGGDFWEVASKILDVSGDELLPLVSDLNRFLPKTSDVFFNKNLKEVASLLKRPDVRNVLIHLSSEQSPYPSKDKMKLYAQEGEGMLAFDNLSEISHNQVSEYSLTPEQIISAFGLEKDTTPSDLNNTIQSLTDYFRQHKGMSIFSDPASTFTSSIENIPLIMSEIAKQKPEIADQLKGKTLGFCRLLAETRPDIDSKFASPDSYKIKIYKQITEKTTRAVMEFYDLNNVAFLNEIVYGSPSSVFDIEVKNLIIDTLGSYNSQTIRENHSFK